MPIHDQWMHRRVLQRVRVESLISTKQRRRTEIVTTRVVEPH